jgi:UDP-N-acetylmuramate dehydrogenase
LLRRKDAVEIPRDLIDELSKLGPGEARLDEPMARHTSFGLGGPADILLAPEDASAFRDAAACVSGAGIPITILGRGTNVLVRTAGIEGAVLIVGRAFSDVARDGETVVAGSGAPLSAVLALCSREGLSGTEGLAGIPGSVGGALVTNAGSFGVSFGELLLDVVVFEPGRSASSLAVDDLEIGYRRTSIPAGTIVERVRLGLERDRPDAVAERQRRNLDEKWRTQPVGMRSAGCVFRNPPGDSAGRIIDSLGLKGTRIGGAVVSDHHANFILNDRGATADDVEDLIELVRSRVLEETGVELSLEIEILGRRAN